MSQIREAISRQDEITLEIVGHGMKGCVNNLAHSGDIATTKGIGPELEMEIASFSHVSETLHNEIQLSAKRTKIRSS